VIARPPIRNLPRLLFAIWPGPAGDRGRAGDRGLAPVRALLAAPRAASRVGSPVSLELLPFVRLVVVIRMPDATAASLAAAARELSPLLAKAGAELGVNVGGPERGCSAGELGALLRPLAPTWLQLPERAEPAASFDLPACRVLRSCHDFAGIAAALRGGADACTLSPIWSTASKRDHPGLGLPELASACDQWPGRIVALGGIDGGRAAAALGAGAAGISALSAPWDARRTALLAAFANASAVEPRGASRPF